MIRTATPVPNSKPPITHILFERNAFDCGIPSPPDVDGGIPRPPGADCGIPSPPDAGSKPEYDGGGGVSHRG